MPINLAAYEWKLPEASPKKEQQIKELQQAGLKHSPAFLRLCLERGLDTLEKIKKATDPAPQLFHDPFLMYDMDRVVERLSRAIEEGEVICIYGDYDADGITATLIMKEGLEMLGANVRYYLPNRHIDGYGPNLERYKQLIEEGTDLIVTVDNGIVGDEAISYAQDQGVDVIVTDHHQIQEHLPPAYAVIHPAHPKGQYPFHDLAGAGVALKVISALLGEVPSDSLDLAAIGTVADLVSLTDENRTLVRAGLLMMQQSPRPGLLQLLEKNNIQLPSLNSRTIGFTIGPRLNALGRLGDPSPGLQLLESHDPEEINRLLTLLEQTNAERQHQVEAIYEQLVQEWEGRETKENIILASDPAWNPGVLGIVAGRLCERYHRPVILFQEQEGVYKGSGRSIQRVNLFNLLQAASDTIQYYGGHSQAAGLTVAADRFEDFYKKMVDLAADYEQEIKQADPLEVDVALNLEEINEALIEEFALLEPFGMGNKEPVVYIPSAAVVQSRAIGRQEDHLKLEVADGNGSLQAIGFSKAEQGKGLTPGDQLALVGSLSINEWNNRRLPQLQIQDLGMSQTLWIDVRGSKLAPQIQGLEHALYVFRHKALKEHYMKALHPSSQAITYEDVQIIDGHHFQQLVIMEPPKQLEDLLNFSALSFPKIYLGSYVHQSYYMVGLPQREEAGKLYRYLQQTPEFAVREKLPHIAQVTRIDPFKIETLLLMFLEAGFVTIEQGYLRFNRQAQGPKVDLEQLPSYLAFQKAYEAEKLLNYQRLNKIQDYMKENK